MVTVNKARRKDKTALRDNLKKLYYLAEKRSFNWNAQTVTQHSSYFSLSHYLRGVGIMKIKCPNFSESWRQVTTLKCVNRVR